MFAQLKRYYNMVDGEIYIGLDLHILIEFSFNYKTVSYTHLTLPTKQVQCRSRWSPYH